MTTTVLEEYGFFLQTDAFSSQFAISGDALLRVRNAPKEPLLCIVVSKRMPEAIN